MSSLQPWQHGLGPSEVRTLLFEGNRRFVEARSTGHAMSPEKRASLVHGQHPLATVITCSDSRVVPEYLFDRTLGELFVIRTAGNVLDEVSLGTVEYGVGHVHTPLVVILGHSHCGAVTAALGPGSHAEGGVAKILDIIAPAVARARAAGLSHRSDTLNLAIRENVRHVRRAMLDRSRILGGLVDAGKVEILAAVYVMETGEVVELPDREP